jgi:hypothetical protein
MRKFTKSILALALLFMGVSNASAQEDWVEIYKVNYSDYTSFPWYVMGYTPTWVEGVMTDDPATIMGTPGWHQYFIADGIPTTHADKKYKVRALVKCSDWFGLTVNMGWGWGETEKVVGGPSLSPSDDFQWVEWQYEGIEGTSCNLVAQPWSGSVKIEWKELRVYEPGVPPSYTDILTNGDVEGVNSSYTALEDGVGKFWAKIVSGENGPSVAGTHAVEVKSSGNEENEWDSQFYISMPKRLPSGTRFKITFDYKASATAAAATQWQNGPSEYLWWNCIGDVNFTTAWKTFERTGTVPQKEDNDHNMVDMTPYSIAFNLARTAGPITYYFDNFKFEVLDEDVAGLTEAPAVENKDYPSDPVFTVGAAGYATFGYDAPVVFGDDVEAYAAVYNAGGYVELTQLAGAAKNTAVVLKAAPGNYTAKVQNVAAPEANGLLVSDGTVTGDGTIYVLAKKDKGVGFYKLASGDKVPAGKAYLTIPASAPDFLGFDGGTTSISEKTVVKNNADGEFYNLAGQRVAQPTKGLYIVNGKKVVIK